MEKKHLDQLVPHLYISDWDSSNDIHLLKKDNIKAIISLTTYDKPNNVLDLYTKNNIDHLDIDILDAPFANISKFFDTTSDFIKKHIDVYYKYLLFLQALKIFNGFFFTLKKFMFSITRPTFHITSFSYI